MRRPRRPAAARPGTGGQQAGERVQKVLAGLGLASRREAEEWIRAGRVGVNARPAQLGQRVQPEDQLSLDGRPIRQRMARQARVYLCHRSPGEPLLPGAARAEAPPGSAGTHADEAATPSAPPAGSLAERLPRNAGRRWIAISPMPRPDGGLELLSGDGALALRLQRAVRGLEAEFSLRLRGELTQAQREGALGGELDRGVRLAVQALEDGGGEGSNRWYRLIVTGASGKDVRQLLERQGAQVSRIIRVRLGSVGLERALARGQSRALTDAELETLLAPPASAATPASDADSERDAPPVHRGRPRPRLRR